MQESQKPSKVDKGLCIERGHCVSVCPENSIFLQAIPGVEDPPEFLENVFSTNYSRKTIINNNFKLLIF